MGRWVPVFWQNSYASGLRRRDGRSGEYHAYLPDPLSTLPLWLSPGTQDLAVQAERRVRGLSAAPDLEGIGRFLLRSEAIASSRIEGIAPSAHKIALAELGQREKVQGLSSQAKQVADNVTLVRHAVGRLTELPLVSSADLLALHRSLLTDQPQLHGLRDAQNWVGGSPYHPLDADYVPPPPQEVPPLVEDLLRYLNGATHAPLVQAALVHAQFETIHPFADGNGRVGRALIHAVLARRGLIGEMVLPVSLVLATLSKQYLLGLSAFRCPPAPEPGGRGSPAGDPGDDTQACREGCDAWVAFFLEAVLIACDQAERIGAELAGVRQAWEEALRHWATAHNGGRLLRRDAAARRIADGLAATPVLTIATASQVYEVSRTAAAKGLEILEQAGVLATESIGPGRRAYVARDVLDTITWAERRLASTRFDTRISPPVRPVPAPAGRR